MNIEHYTIEQLKALAYDLVVQSNKLQLDLDTINKLINKKMQEAQSSPEVTKIDSSKVEVVDNKE